MRILAVLLLLLHPACHERGDASNQTKSVASDGTESVASDGTESVAPPGSKRARWTIVATLNTYLGGSSAVLNGLGGGLIFTAATMDYNGVHFAPLALGSEWLNGPVLAPSPESPMSNVSWDSDVDASDVVYWVRNEYAFAKIGFWKWRLGDAVPQPSEVWADVPDLGDVEIKVSLDGHLWLKVQRREPGGTVYPHSELYYRGPTDTSFSHVRAFDTEALVAVLLGGSVCYVTGGNLIECMSPAGELTRSIPLPGEVQELVANRYGVAFARTASTLSRIDLSSGSITAEIAVTADTFAAVGANGDICVVQGNSLAHLRLASIELDQAQPLARAGSVVADGAGHCYLSSGASDHTTETLMTNIPEYPGSTSSINCAGAANQAFRGSRSRYGVQLFQFSFEGDQAR